MKKRIHGRKRDIIADLLARYFIVAIPLLVVFTPAQADSRTVLVLGDSLSSAYRIPSSSGWVTLLQQRLRERGHDYGVINASVSGATTEKALAALPKVLARHRPDIVVVELGGNDGLRRLPLEQMKNNLTAIVKQAKSRQASVLLVGLRLPPEYNGPYGDQFKRVYREVAMEQKVPLVPLILDGVDNDISLFQRDRIHPIADAQPRLLENVWSQLQWMLWQPIDVAEPVLPKQPPTADVTARQPAPGAAQVLVR